MSITPEEKEAIINEACERALLKLPEVFATLWERKVSMEKLKKKFYKDNDGFELHKPIVLNTLGELEGKNPGIQYEQLLEKAVPIIKQRIGVIASKDMGRIEKPSINNVKIRDDGISMGEL